MVNGRWLLWLTVILYYGYISLYHCFINFTVNGLMFILSLTFDKPEKCFVKFSHWLHGHQCYACEIIYVCHRSEGTCFFYFERKQIFNTFWIIGQTKQLGNIHFLRFCAEQFTIAEMLTARKSLKT